MKKKLTFEQSLERLEEIAALLEQGNAPLEDALKLYEEGTALAAECSRTLNAAQIKITELSALQNSEKACQQGLSEEDK